eukprot:TRINITY_DN5745_c0_g1_i2.p1 TRINITY_DN5745_c0_g1~~TRINITY_DN5745_c0_g1_i2.p1  ORF type:complete len:780 (+),score=203.59 TRINITY_DN5745_c0_g1_i2:20-2359(+)
MDELTIGERKAITTLLRQHNDEDLYVCRVKVADPKKKKAPEERILVIGRHRLYFFKPAGKLSESSHMLEILEVLSPADSQLGIKTKTFSVGFTDPPAVLDQVLINLIAAYKANIQDRPLPLTIPDRDRLGRIQNAAKELMESIENYCGGFVSVYQATCDQMKIPVCADIAWDIDNLYVLNDTTDFNIFELCMRQERISNNDWRALLHALERNSYFTGLIFDNSKADRDIMNMIAAVLQKNTKISKVVLKDTGMPSSYFASLALNFEGNKGLSLTHLDLSGNPIEDKGAIALATALGELKQGMVHLNLARCSIDRKGVLAIVKALSSERHLATLESLNISNNKTDSEVAKALATLLIRANNLRDLNLGFTTPEFHLINGKNTIGNLTTLDLSGIKVITKDSRHMDMLRFLQFAPNITKLILAKSNFPVEIAGEMLKSTPNLTHLDLSETGMADTGLGALTESLKILPSLKYLSLNRNFEKATKQRHDIVSAFVSYLNDTTRCNLETLHFQGYRSPFKSELVPLIFGLMANKKLKHIDVSGHSVGNSLALAFSKVLQVNDTLESVTWDDNQITFAGYTMFRSGLQRNESLVSMVIPTNDLANSMSKERDNKGFSLGDVIRDIQERCIANSLIKRDVVADREGAEYVEMALPPPENPAFTEANKPEWTQPNRMSVAPPMTQKLQKDAKDRKSKARKAKQSGIDTAHVSALFGHLNNFLDSPDCELSAEEVAKFKAELGRRSSLGSHRESGFSLNMFPTKSDSTPQVRQSLYPDLHVEPEETN